MRVLCNFTFLMKEKLIKEIITLIYCIPMFSHPIYTHTHTHIYIYTAAIHIVLDELRLNTAKMQLLYNIQDYALPNSTFRIYTKCILNIDDAL